MSDATAIHAFIARWSGNAAGEMKVAQQHFLELCDALGVPKPTPQEQEAHTFCFELPVVVPTGKGKAPATERADVYKQGCFLWENKQGSESSSERTGHGRRGSLMWSQSMVRARAQAVRYARHLEGRAPPALVVCDVGYAFEVWLDFTGTAREFDQRPSRRILLADLHKPENADFLRAVLRDPTALDPSKVQQRVTREVAADLASLAVSLEALHPPEAVARFIVRCVFTMFAEDVGLLPEKSFATVLDHFLAAPADLTQQLTHLWRLMNDGGFAYGMGKVPRFNGGLFHDAEALPLSKEGVRSLANAASRDWSMVDPTLFGTLVERALDPVERHRLGAHFTPRAFIERLVRPAVIEPLRDQWLGVQAEVRAILAKGGADPKPAQIQRAVDLIQDFHADLCRVRVLDPACGTGNFLVVTYDLLKDLEHEVLQTLADLGVRQTAITGLSTVSVHPQQLLGIEKNPRAREVAELVVWLAHLQRIRRDTGDVPRAEPILRDLHNIEGRDAVLTWDGDPVPRLDPNGQPIRVWDQRTTRKDPITGRDVPDESATVLVVDYPNARQATWPDADFIVSNPPFVGNKRMRMALGDGYAEALRKAWPEVPGGVDLVMYWWERAASLVRAGAVRRFGMITTNSITQVSNRAVIQPHLDAGLSLSYAVADHPWVADGAAVRIAMTVAGPPDRVPRRGIVVAERETDDVPEVEVVEKVVAAIHADLEDDSGGTRVVPLAANRGLCFTGMYPLGDGFLLTPDEIERLPATSRISPFVRPLWTARDLTQTARHLFIIDFFPLSESAAFNADPTLFGQLVDRVKPVRATNKVAERRNNWWLFTRPVPPLRDLQRKIERIIAVPRTSKHITPSFLESNVVVDTSVVAICSDDPWLLGILSSGVHRRWAMLVGGRLGVGNDPRYQHKSTFNPFPFPDLTDYPALRERIGTLAERLDAHRKSVQAKVPKAHLTAQYNALARAREAKAGGPPLTEKERAFHEAALIGVLRSLHDDLDAAVAEAYGWPVTLSDEELLERIVALNRERAAEEARGQIRWLRPDLQAKAQPGLDLPEPDDEPTDAEPAAPTRTPWPPQGAAQVVALRNAIAAAPEPLTPDALFQSFDGAKRPAFQTALEALIALGMVTVEDGTGRVVSI